MDHRLQVSRHGQGPALPGFQLIWDQLLGYLSAYCIPGPAIVLDEETEAHPERSSNAPGIGCTCNAQDAIGSPLTCPPNVQNPSRGLRSGVHCPDSLLTTHSSPAPTYMHSHTLFPPSCGWLKDLASHPAA